MPTTAAALSPIPEPEVLPRNGNEIDHPNCLVVDPQLAGITGELVATVEHLELLESPDGFPWQILPVVNKAIPMKDAMEQARAYASEQGVPVILVNQEQLATAKQRHRTDTSILPLPR